MPTAPTGVPTSLSLLQPINNLTWNEVDCSRRNGLITGYTVMISNSSITYNLTSTERYIILNDLVFDTVYIISVAAVNSAGRGPFSDPIALLLHPSQSSVYLSDISQTYISTSTSNNGVIILGVLGGVWLILLTITFIYFIYYFLRLQISFAARQAKTDEDIAMQVCTPYDLHKTELPSEENEGAYEECEAPPDAVTDDSIYDL
ncbi:PREDICTED: uncharacterized protein LOC109590287 [Amphimedon queenslandica]|nr:PREDICTED: uncharacterized protein LOC109590287 [Amphimedon queenslandica]|eukprot:XP_019861767.1 PREDICTED: uncharacterized protein LOC109590287 [Amphimedon queenslandica]